MWFIDTKLSASRSPRLFSRPLLVRRADQPIFASVCLPVGCRVPAPTTLSLAFCANALVASVFKAPPFLIPTTFMVSIDSDQRPAPRHFAASPALHAPTHMDTLVNPDCQWLTVIGLLPVRQFLGSIGVQGAGAVTARPER